MSLTKKTEFIFFSIPYFSVLPIRFSATKSFHLSLGTIYNRCSEPSSCVKFQAFKHNSNWLVPKLNTIQTEIQKHFPSPQCAKWSAPFRSAQFELIRAYCTSNALTVVCQLDGIGLQPSRQRFQDQDMHRNVFRNCSFAHFGLSH